ncbi:uracil-DNA glycosylase [Myriangium duriaei CBS 260.36]|uniref:Uracil-DNA glycosylase n=1 Tax=Myriangium duriaei CBS 260.36 TaxID=1168546 RepID=A0A9P4J4Q8_9PEZI|nr:uracil-DNA glycosylase [Myriangium duriaei CBS 260.36]
MTTTSPSLKRKAVDLAEAEHKKPKQDGSITAFFGAPKAKSAAPKAAATATATAASTTTNTDATETATATTATTVTATAKFDKEAWAAKLTPEQRGLLQLELDTLDETWFAALKDELLKPSFLALKKFLREEHVRGAKIFPPAPDVYSWSRHTPLSSVKAVILGQDPYHNDNQAHGLCFSVRPPTLAPPSLKNMYVALKKDYPSFSPPPKGGGLLTPWADRGVLLLNTCLTVRAHEANSHAGKGWEGFTQKVIDLVAKKRTNGVVFLAWGKPAQQRCKGVNGMKHLVLQSVHPSPLSAHRGFLDCGHFKKANEWLEQRYGPDGGIDWDLNVAPEKAGV